MTRGHNGSLTILNRQATLHPDPCAGLSRPLCRYSHVRWAFSTTVVCTLIFLMVSLAIGQQPVAPTPATTLPNEYTVKAVFLYSFGRYVQWPERAFHDAKSPFVIGVLGEDPFGDALNQIAAKKTVQGRPIVIARFATVDDYRGSCHILFVSKSMSIEQESALLAKTKQQPIFVTGETPGFAERGATANFYVDGDRIRFELNETSARQSQLRLDAKLLSLGKPIGAPKQPGAN